MMSSTTVQMLDNVQLGAYTAQLNLITIHGRDHLATIVRIWSRSIP